MKKSVPPVGLYHRIAGTYVQEQQRFFAKHHDAARSFLYEAVPRPIHQQNLLDIGCGNGTDIKYFSSVGYNVWGIDSSPEMVTTARAGANKSEQIVLGNFLTTRQIPLGLFDVVYTRFTLHYLQDIAPGYRRIAKLLRPGGLFACVVAHPYADPQFTTPARRGQPRMVHYPLYGGKVTVIYPPHTLSEYFSPMFFKLYCVEQVGIEPVAAREHKRIPGYLGIIAQRR